VLGQVLAQDEGGNQFLSGEQIRGQRFKVRDGRLVAALRLHGEGEPVERLVTKAAQSGGQQGRGAQMKGLSSVRGVLTCLLYDGGRGDLARNVVVLHCRLIQGRRAGLRRADRASCGLEGLGPLAWGEAQVHAGGIGQVEPVSDARVPRSVRSAAIVHQGADPALQDPVAAPTRCWLAPPTDGPDGHRADIPGLQDVTMSFPDVRRDVDTPRWL
jgi:hypothetical protein